MQKHFRPAAMRVFETKYKDFIRQEFVKVAPISYLTEEILRNAKWRTQMGYDQKIADHLEFQSKMFFSLAFKPNDPRRFDIELLDDLTDLMAGYLAPYFCQKKTCMPKAEAIAHLKRVLFTENQYIINNREKNNMLEQKRAERQAQQLQAKTDSENTPRKKHIIIATNKYNQRVCAVRINLEQMAQKQK